jgi:hypothetical protein
MGLFKRTPRLPAAPQPAGPDEWIGTAEAGHTAREMLYLSALKEAGLDLEAPRILAFAFLASDEAGARLVSDALADTDLQVVTSQAGPMWIISATDRTGTLVPGLAEWAPRMLRIENGHNVLYDGWLALCEDFAKGQRAEFRIAR